MRLWARIALQSNLSCNSKNSSIVFDSRAVVRYAERLYTTYTSHVMEVSTDVLTERNYQLINRIS